MRPNDALGMANSVNPDQTAPRWVYTVCSDLSVRKLRIIMVICLSFTSGFSSDNPPRFQKGKIIPLKELAQCWRSEVIKVGAKTGLTRGSLYSYGLYVRRQHQDGIEEHGPELFNQLEIIPVSDSTKFFDQGDSGALVFMHLNDQDLYCIGLAVGCTSYGSCIVTPIEHVFNELKLPAQFYCP